MFFVLLSWLLLPFVIHIVNPFFHRSFPLFALIWNILNQALGIKSLFLCHSYFLFPKLTFSFYFIPKLLAVCYEITSFQDFLLDKLIVVIRILCLFKSNLDKFANSGSNILSSLSYLHLLIPLYHLNDWTHPENQSRYIFFLRFRIFQSILHNYNIANITKKLK